MSGQQAVKIKEEETESQETSDTESPQKRSFGLNRGKKIYEGYNDERKVKNRKEKEKARLGYTDLYFQEFDKNNNELPAELTDKIVCEDAVACMKKLPDNCIDLIFTSPPYNFGLDYSDHKDVDKWRDYFNNLFAIFDECIRVLKYGGRVVVNIQPLFSDYIPAHHVISNYFMGRGLIWKGEIIWDKKHYNCKYTAWGSWKSPSSPYLKYTWEFLEVFCKGDLKKIGDGSKADITGDEFKKWVNAKWQIPSEEEGASFNPHPTVKKEDDAWWNVAPEGKMKKFGHPAMFPEKLAERAIKLFSFKGDVVLDPFNGAGTTTVVASQNDRRYLGIDLSPEYCKTAQERLGKVQQGLALEQASGSN